MMEDEVRDLVRKTANRLAEVLTEDEELSALVTALKMKGFELCVYQDVVLQKMKKRALAKSFQERINNLDDKMFLKALRIGEEANAND